MGTNTSCKEAKLRQIGDEKSLGFDWSVVHGLDKPTATSRGRQGEEELLTTQREYKGTPDAMQVYGKCSRIRSCFARSSSPNATLVRNPILLHIITVTLSRTNPHFTHTVTLVHAPRPHVLCMSWSVLRLCRYIR